MIAYHNLDLTGSELKNIEQVLTGQHLYGGGHFTEKCQEWLESTLGNTKALLTTSCTAALEMSALLLGISDGDEVIMPSFTFSSTANAFVLRGAVPVFVDIDPRTMNLDSKCVEEAISKKTKAVVPIHYAGAACEMDALCALAHSHDLAIIEDAAQGLLARYKGQYVGTFGSLGAISFHQTKNITSGEGGALLVNDGSLVERAYVLWEKGTNRHSFVQGRVNRYEWIDIGSSFLPSEITAALLWAQLNVSEAITARRRANWYRYYDGLLQLELGGFLQRPKILSAAEINGHIFYVVLPDSSCRLSLSNWLMSHGIQALTHYVPLHSSPAGRRFGRPSGRLAVTEDLSARLLRLPMSSNLPPKAIDHVLSLIVSYFETLYR